MLSVTAMKIVVVMLMLGGWAMLVSQARGSARCEASPGGVCSWRVLTSGGCVGLALAILGFSLQRWSTPKDVAVVSWGLFALLVLGWGGTFACYWSLGRAGAVLLVVPSPVPPRPWWPLVLPGLCGMALMGLSVLRDGPSLGHFLIGCALCAATGTYLLNRYYPLVVTERGFYGWGPVAHWSWIMAYQWTDRQETSWQLTLRLTRLGFLVSLRIPTAYHQALTALLMEKVDRRGS